MTNEEIYKYAWKSGSYGDKLQKQQLKIVIYSALLALLGIFMFNIPLTHLNLLAKSIGCVFMVIMVMIWFGTLMMVTIKNKKQLTNYEYNLVRQDERETMAQMQVDDMFGGKDAI